MQVEDNIHDYDNVPSQIHLEMTDESSGTSKLDEVKAEVGEADGGGTLVPLSHNAMVQLARTRMKMNFIADREQ